MILALRNAASHTPGWSRWLLAAVLLSVATAVVSPSQVAHAQDDTRQKPPESLNDGDKLQLNYFNVELAEVVKFFMDLRGENYITAESQALKEKVTIVTQKPVTKGAAWQAFLSALQVNGYTLVRTGSYYKIIKANEAVQAPLPVRSGSDSIPYSDQVITQLLPLDNISVNDVQSVVNALKSPNGNIIAYNPTNTLIITDHAYNVRKVWEVINELDVGAPKATMAFVQLQFADATEIQSIITELYGVGEESAAAQQEDTRSRRRSRRRRNDDDAATANSGAVSAGKASKYIDKIIADERTNALIVLANEEGHKAVLELVDQLDKDTTGKYGSQINVVRLEQAKAQDVVDVLSRLSEGGNSSGSTRRPTTTRTPTNRGAAAAQQGGEEGFGAIAAFDSGMRIAHDEATNSLVIIASPDDFKVVKKVIDELDRVRKQVFVDAVIMEISSDDSLDFGMGLHGPLGVDINDPSSFDPSTEPFGLMSGSLGQSSALGLSTDLLSGLAMGVFGPSIDVPTATGDTLSIPAFGIVLQAIKTYSGAEVVSNPNLLTLDNAEAKIVVGRKVPFPTNTSFNNLGQPIVTFTREDVAVSLELTPRINSENYVTLEVRVEVSEVEPSDSDLDPLLSGGPVTSKREVETTALVKDNQTVVLGGLVGTTETEVETKVPILGDVPLVGALFRGRRVEARKSNLLIFLTPHIVEDGDDMVEIMRIKEAQFREFRRRFYGKSREQAYEEVQNLLKFSMNIVDKESLYRGNPVPQDNVRTLHDDDANTSSGSREYGRGDSDPNVLPSTDTQPMPPGVIVVPEDADPEDLAVPETGDDNTDGGN